MKKLLGLLAVVGLVLATSAADFPFVNWGPHSLGESSSVEGEGSTFYCNFLGRRMSMQLTTDGSGSVCEISGSKVGVMFYNSLETVNTEAKALASELENEYGVSLRKYDVDGRFVADYVVRSYGFYISIQASLNSDGSTSYWVSVSAKKF